LEGNISFIPLLNYLSESAKLISFEEVAYTYLVQANVNDTVHTQSETRQDIWGTVSKPDNFRGHGLLPPDPDNFNEAIHL